MYVVKRGVKCICLHMSIYLVNIPSINKANKPFDYFGKWQPENVFQNFIYQIYRGVGEMDRCCLSFIFSLLSLFTKDLISLSLFLSLSLSLNDLFTYLHKMGIFILHVHLHTTHISPFVLCYPQAHTLPHTPSNLYKSYSTPTPLQKKKKKKMHGHVNSFIIFDNLTH